MRPLIAVFLALACCFALGQNDPPSARLELSSTSAKPGEKVKGTVTVSFGPGLHAYQNPPSEDYLIPLTITASGDVKLESVKYPSGISAKVGGAPDPVKVYEGTLRVPIVLAAPSKPGSYDVKLSVGYQQCDATQCFQPDSVSTTAKLTVEAATKQAVTQTQQQTTTPKALVTPPVKQQTQPQVRDPKASKTPDVKPAPPQKQPVQQQGDPKIQPPTKEVENPVDKGTPVETVAKPTPTKAVVTDPAPIVSAPSAAFAPTPSAPDTSGDGFIARNLRDAFKTGNYFFVIVLAMLTGLALAATPCVYPMIPVTVGFFSNQAAGNRAARVLLGLMFMLGLALTFGAVAGVSLALGGSVGSLFQAPWFLLALGVLMIALALSMFDVYEIRLPQFLGKQIHGRSGATGALVMGLLMGFAAAPCSGPVVAVFAVKVAELGSIPVGLLLFTCIGLGLGLPFFALGAFATNAGALPKSGGWLKTLKAILGLVVLWIALDYLLKAAQLKSGDPTTLLIQAIFLVGAGSYLFLLERSGNTQLIWGMKGVAILLCGIFAGQLLHARDTVFRDRQLAALGVTSEVKWTPFTMAAFEEAKKSGKPIVIDVTADWCVVCREIEEAVFHKPEGIAAMKNVAALRVDQSTGVDPAYVKMTNELFKIKGLPHLEILKPGGEPVKVITGKAELDSPAKLKEFLSLARR
jgi:thiol:disulfide interchange protein DsbD